MDLARCMGCKTCELACAVVHSRSRRTAAPIMHDLYAAIAEEPAPAPRVRVLGVSLEHYPQIYMPVQCRHCEKPPCVAACVTGALSRDPSGKVELRPERCIGCRMCVMVCPYGAIRVHRRLGVAIKCDLCPQEPIPACVSACPTKALIYAEEDELLKLKHGKVAERLGEALTLSPGARLVDLGSR